MIVVVNDFVGPLVKTATHPGATLPGFEEGVVLSETMDVTVYHVCYWRSLVYENVVRILLCMGIPKVMVPLEKEPANFVLNYQRLKLNLYEYVKARERVSRSMWRKGQLWPAKKQLLHVLRVLTVAHQLVKTGHIVDYTEANHFWPSCAQATLDSFEMALKWYKDRYTPLYETLKAQLNIYKPIFDDLRTRNRTLNPLPIFDYLQLHCQDDTTMLERETSVRAITLDYPLTEAGKTENSNWLLFERSLETPKYQELLQCYKIVAQRISSEEKIAYWKVLAIAPKKFWEYGSDRYVVDASEKFVDKLEYRTTKVFKRPQGIGVLVFWHEDELCAVFGSSGFYASQFCLRHSCSNRQIGHHVHTLFWQTFRRKEYREPDKELRHFCFHFVFHPDEDLLVLGGIMNLYTLMDVTLSPTCQVMPLEPSTEPFLFSFKTRLNWTHLENVSVNFPSLKAATENSVSRNMDVIAKLATGATDMSLLCYEGFLLIDAHNTRVQVSLPQYHALSMVPDRYERKNRTRHFLKIVRATLKFERGEELFCTYFPEWAAWYRYTASVFRRICAQMELDYEPLSKIDDQTKFKEAVDQLPFAQSKIFWKLRSTKSSAFDYFTDLANLNEGPGTSAILSWVDHFHVFDDVNQPDEE